MDDVRKLCDRVRETAYSIHLYLAHGHLERVYENALVHRLRKAGLKVGQQHPIKVHDDDNTLIGEYFADVVVNDVLLVELKAVRMISREHEAQLLGYLRATGMEHGLLINFGACRFQIRKYVHSRDR